MADTQPVQSYDQWPISDVTRNLIVERIASNLAAYTFFNEQQVARIGNETARQYAEEIEKAAFEAAKQRAQEDLFNSSELIALYSAKSSHLMMSKLTRVGQEVQPVIPAELEDQNERAEAVTVLDVSGERKFVKTAEACRELVQPLFDHPITKVRLSTKSFYPEAAAVVAEGLSIVRDRLDDVDFSDIIAGQEEKYALETLTIVTSALEGSNVRKLNLSDNAFGEKGLRACETALCLRSLQELYLRNNGISVDACKWLRDSLTEVPNLRIFHFYNNMSGDEGATAIGSLLERATNLQSFQFRSTRVNTEAGIALCSGLAAGDQLEFLDLTDNPFMPEVARPLTNTLLRHVNLRELHLAEIGLGDEGATILARGLRNKLPKLQVLDLSGNDLTVASARHVARLVASCHVLVKVLIAENELKNKGTARIASGITANHTKLEEVHLNTNEMCEEGAVAIAKVVAGLPSFNHLNVNANSISVGGMEALKDIFKKVFKLDALGPLDENEEDGGGDEEEEDEEEDEDDDDDVQGLGDQLQAMGI